MILLVSALTSFWVRGARNEQLKLHSAVGKDLLGLKNFLKNKDYQFFCLVKDPVSGEMIHWGDSDFAFDYLKEQKGVERRLSRDWIPEKDIKMTQPLPFVCLWTILRK